MNYLGTDHTIQDSINVMIVDDSILIRGSLIKLLQEDPGINIVTTANNGESAIAYLKRFKVEVLLLDIEMPEIDGISLLPKLLFIAPNLRVIMVSNLTTKYAPIAIQALSLGASDYIEKPSSLNNANSREVFKSTLIEKIKILGRSAKRISQIKSTAEQDAPIETTINKLISVKDINIRITPNIKPRAIAIASSTGGPQALQNLFSYLSSSNILQYVPFFITQHMPATFTTFLASHINMISKAPCVEVTNKEKVKTGTIYLAAGNFHLEVSQTYNKIFVDANQKSPINFCRPSADFMISSLINVYGANLLLIILTGMGKDGLEGARKLAKSGGIVIAQDENSSIVWGMPGVVAQAGICNAVLPLNGIANYIITLLNKGYN